MLLLPSRDIMRECWPLVRLALPLVLSMLGGIAINTTDMLMLGRLGPEALAATALGLSIFHPLMLFGVGIGLAVTPMAAEALSAHRLRQMRRVVRQGIWAAIPFTLLCFLPFWFSGSLFLAVGQDPGLAHSAELYTRGVWPGLFFILLFNVLRSYMTALERTHAVLIVTILGVPLNAALNYVLIFGAFGIPALGVLGAAIGSSLTNISMGIALSIWCLRQKPFRRHAIFGRFWRPDWKIFMDLHRIGIPIGVMIVLEVAIFAGAAQIMGLIGTLELAAHQIAIQLAGIAFMVPLGIGQAATARVGLAYGKAGMAKAGNAGWAAIILSTVAMSATGLLFWLTPELLIQPFLNDDADAGTLLRFAVSYLAIAAAFQIVDGLQVTAAHNLRGLQDTKVPMWIAAAGYWGVALPVAYYFGLHTELQGLGVWAGLALGLAVCALALVYRFHCFTKKSPTLAPH